MNIYRSRCKLASLELVGLAKMKYANTILQQKMSIAGENMTDILKMCDNRIIGVLNPTSTQDVATKNYTDLTLGAVK